MAIKSQIPNLLTLSNLLCGALAVFCISQGALVTAAYLVVVAALFDVADGLVARLLGVSGPLGKQLDSLADMVSFGLVPGLMALALMGSFDRTLDFSTAAIFAFSPLLMVAFSAYRLAKFNIDTRQSDQFIGVPTPANALFWISLPLIAQAAGPSEWLAELYATFLGSETAIVLSSLVCGVLLIVEWPLLSLKFKNLGFRENAYRYLLLISGAGLLAIFWVQAIPIILILYLTLSSIQNLTQGTQDHGIQS
jgi:CDP-diacylglycerol--serine O-phosphatidyltransferase